MLQAFNPRSFNPLSRWMPWSPRLAAPLRTVRRPRAPRVERCAWDNAKPLPALAEELSESSAQCGWFDSSHELQCGLMVLEHEGLETLAGEMPPGPWLDLYAALPMRVGFTPPAARPESLPPRCAALAACS